MREERFLKFWHSVVRISPIEFDLRYWQEELIESFLRCRPAQEVSKQDVPFGRRIPCLIAAYCCSPLSPAVHCPCLLRPPTAACSKSRSHASIGRETTTRYPISVTALLFADLGPAKWTAKPAHSLRRQCAVHSSKSSTDAAEAQAVTSCFQLGFLSCQCYGEPRRGKY
jgi:hypothetical protein